jgi:hypothetical protein
LIDGLRLREPSGFLMAEGEVKGLVGGDGVHGVVNTGFSLRRRVG